MGLPMDDEGLAIAGRIPPPRPLRELWKEAKSGYDSHRCTSSLMTRSDGAEAWTPDENAQAFVDSVPDAARYDGHSADPHEVAGIMRAAMPSGGSWTLAAEPGRWRSS
jgi:hypothetical protein